jgi:hypothetical protein
MEEDAPPTKQQRRNARYVTYAMYYLAGVFAVGAILNFAISWWGDHPSRAIFGAVSMLGLSGYLVYQATHFCDDDPEKLS